MTRSPYTVLEGSDFWRWYSERFPGNIWSEFPLYDTDLRGLFIFAKLCRDAGISNDYLPDISDGKSMTMFEVDHCVALLNSDSSTSRIKHSGPTSEERVDYCTCLLCRWRSVMKVLICPSHSWSPARFPPGVRRLVEEGVPSTIREHVWLYLSGGLQLMRTRRPNYVSHFPAALSSPFLELIDLDIQRTFSDDSEWRQRDYDKVTRRVLLAYADRNKTLGYCQGLSFIVGILVTVVNEEIAFIILCSIIEDHLLPPDYYTSLAGAVVDKSVLEHLVDRFLPSLRSRLASDDSATDVSFMSIPWNMCLFSANLSRNLSVRVWDLLFAFGSCALFRISLGILGELDTDHSRPMDFRSSIKLIESKLSFSDILCFMQRFEQCDNDLISKLRDKIRNSSPNAPSGFLTVCDSRGNVSDDFLPSPQRPVRSDRARIRNKEVTKRTIDGLGDFMGQPRPPRHNQHHTH